MKRLLQALCFIIVILGLVLMGSQRYHTYKKEQERQNLQQEIAQKILRFHILANSDSTQDQKVKLEVRDAVGNFLSTLLEDSSSLEESEKIVSDRMDEIIAVANESLQKAGWDYGATAYLADVEFPEKTYGSYVFPKGNYKALEIVLGEGQGHNWWCVLYPNMCFSNCVYEVDEQADEKLRQVLTTEEYEAVFTDGNYEVRLKLLEYFK